MSAAAAGGSVSAGVDPAAANHMYAVLLHTFDPDPIARDGAEVQIKALRRQPGCLLVMLHIAREPSVNKDVQLAAVISLKNAIKDCWDDRKEGKSPFSAQEKDVTKDCIVEALMAESDKRLQKQLAECIKDIAVSDYPEVWPQLLPSLVANMQTGEVLRVRNALTALYKLVSRYEFKPKEAREPLFHIMQQVFPLLQNIAKTLLEETSAAAEEVVKLILKILWSGTQFQLPVKSGAVFTDMGVWLEILMMSLSKPTTNEPESVEMRPASPCWKIKKWATRILSRYFSRYGNPHYADQCSQEFAKAFSEQYAPLALGEVMRLLARRAEGQYCTDIVVHACLQFVNNAIELSNTYKLLKPHLDLILVQIVFPVMCISEEDEDLFENEPQEFLVKRNEMLEDFLDPANSAINLISSLAKYRGGDVLPRLLPFLSRVLTDYAEAPPEKKQHRTKDGAFVTLGSLVEVLKKKKYVGSLEPLLVQHVLPEFGSSVGYLRFRACWMVSQFSEVKFSNTDNLLALLQAILRALSDQCLPVRVEATRALCSLINIEATHPTIISVLPAILNACFEIMREVGSDVVVMTLESIIQNFEEHIAPHAVGLAASLSECFLNYAREGEEDDESALAAGQCMEAIGTLLKSAQRMPQLYPALEAFLIPALTLVMDDGGGEYLEYLENAVEAMSFLTYYGQEISPALWSLYPKMVAAFDNYAYDFIAQLVVPMDNYICRGTDVFLSGVSPEGVKFIDLAIGMAAKVLEDAEMAEQDSRMAVWLLISIVNSCRGRVDAYIPSILTIMLTKLASPSSSALTGLTSTLLQGVGCCLYYDPQITLTWLHGQSADISILQKIKSDVCGKEEVPVLCKKLVVLGVTSILQLPTSRLPPSISAYILGVMDIIVGLLEEILTDEAQNEAGAEAGDSQNGDGDEDGTDEADEEEDEDVDGVDENEDVAVGEDQMYLQSLRRAVDPLSFLGDDFLYDDEDEEDFHSPLDDVDAPIFFLRTFKSACEREPEAFRHLQASLGGEMQARIQKVIDAAASREDPFAQA
jgi:hypothetical protein